MGIILKVENFRPLSIISSFAKIYEQVVSNQFTDFLESSATVQFLESLIKKIKYWGFLWI